MKHNTLSSLTLGCCADRDDEGDSEADLQLTKQRYEVEQSKFGGCRKVVRGQDRKSGILNGSFGKGRVS